MSDQDSLGVRRR